MPLKVFIKTVHLKALVHILLGMLITVESAVFVSVRCVVKVVEKRPPSLIK